MRADQLGVQLHCLRHEVRESLSRTLDSIRRLGVAAVELVSFPGCRGNPWGDFGAVADLPARAIHTALDAAGLQCPSVMVNERELAPDRIDASLDWVRGVGADAVVLTAFAGANGSTRVPWRTLLPRANVYAERCRERGIAFVLHTQPELWTVDDGQGPIDLLASVLDPTLVSLEYDPSGPVMQGVDPTALLSAWHGRFHAVHLRDGFKPAESVPYLPALPLGDGVVDWAAFTRACRDAAVHWYFLEMEVAAPTATMAALASSLAHLATLGLPASPAVEFVRPPAQSETT